MQVRYLSVKSRHAPSLRNLPSFHVSGSISGMKKLFYGKHALLIRCGSWIYNATGEPDLYYRHAR